MPPMPQRTLTISDPVRIRALSHPLRLRLLEVLGEGPATATDCAQATGASVASCSFHLRSLAKYGYIEAAERRGKEKPWRLAHNRRDILPEEEIPGSILAVAEISKMLLERRVENIGAWIEAMPGEPAEWNRASTTTHSSLWATAGEVAELARGIHALLDHFEGRNDDPSRRPEEARPVALFAAVHPDVARERRLAGGTS